MGGGLAEWPVVEEEDTELVPLPPRIHELEETVAEGPPVIVEAEQDEVELVAAARPRAAGGPG